MSKQEFLVTIRVKTDIESSGKPYLTESRVKKQLEKFLSSRHMADGLPCHGTSKISVVDVIQDV